MTLRAEPARPSDLPGALDLLRRTDLADRDVAERFGHYFVVREDDGRVVGVTGLEVHGADALLRSVAVDPAYRDQGLGGSLVAAALEYFLGKGFADCTRDEAPEAIRGSWEFRAGCPSTAAFMHQDLTSARSES